MAVLLDVNESLLTGTVPSKQETEENVEKVLSQFLEPSLDSDDSNDKQIYHFISYTRFLFFCITSIY